MITTHLALFFEFGGADAEGANAPPLFPLALHMLDGASPADAAVVPQPPSPTPSRFFPAGKPRIPKELRAPVRTDEREPLTLEEIAAALIVSTDTPETALAQVESALIDLGVEPITTTHLLEVVEVAIEDARIREERATLLAHLEAEHREHLLALLEGLDSTLSPLPRATLLALLLLTLLE